jgi:hypothetical protein
MRPEKVRGQGRQMQKEEHKKRQASNASSGKSPLYEPAE